MITVRPASERGHADHGWLRTWHSFSFADYFDRRWMGHSTLRVLNDDIVAPATGFGRHPHRDMEIVTWVLSGALAHQDSMGNGSVIRPGEAQRMTAGTGVFHSEKNPSPDEPVHLLQIWILPDREGLTPGYEQVTIPEASRRGRLATLASRDGRDGSVTIHQDATILTSLLEPGETVAHRFAAGRSGWLHVASGAVTAAGFQLSSGDGLALTKESALEITASAPSEVLLFDLS